MTNEVPFDLEYWGNQLKDADLDLNNLSATKWDVSETVTQSKGEVERKFRLTKAGIGLDLKFRGDRIELGWDAKLPSFMRPGNGSFEMFEFIDEITDKIPSKFCPDPDRSREQAKNLYRNFTELFIFPRPESGPSYRIRSEEREVADLAINFASPNSIANIDSIRVVGRKGPLSSYMLDLKYSKLPEDPDKVNLILKQHKNINYSFSPYSMGWFLETHVNSERLRDSDKELMSEELSEQAVNCLDKWLQLNRID